MKNLILFMAIIFWSVVLPAQDKIALQLYASGFNIPVDLAFDNRDQLYVVEKGGRVKAITTFGNKIFLDISDRVNSGANERGLLGLTFHPEYHDNGHFFVNYTGGNGQTVISRFTRSMLDSTIADKASEKILMTVAQPFNNHNAGDLNFGPDGFLYIALGDGGSGGDPGNRSQNPKERLGKMLRIDVDTDQTHYLIPGDNPFAGNPDTLGEIWSMGLRNPWRFSFDKLTQDLWIADVGQKKWEEVNLEIAGSPGGLNYGWRCFEGFEKYEFALCDNATDFHPPVFVYANNSGGEGCSITGGFVYRGEEVPYLYGHYIFGDFCSGKIWRLHKNSCGPAYSEQLAEFGPQELSTFGQDSKGEIFLAALGEGKIYKISDACSLSLDGITAFPPSCKDAMDGKIIFNISSTSNYAIQINGALPAAGYAAGQYTYLVTDQNTGCTQTGCVIVPPGNEDPPCDYENFIEVSVLGPLEVQLDLCAGQVSDIIEVLRGDTIVYTGQDPVSIPGAGVYTLSYLLDSCSYTLDSVLTVVYRPLVEVPQLVITDSFVRVSGPFRSFAMFVNDTLYEENTTGIFVLPIPGSSTFIYFLGEDEDGCISSKSETITLSGINRPINRHSLLYPNPAGDKIYNPLEGSSEMAIYNGSYHLIQIITNPGREINVSDIPSGMYFVRIKKSNTNFWYKVYFEK
ncbi:MAG: PQQ-dependent sugar dehydrogenase [Saprospiraceae bacterium]|nr:PQQ-dependent sugar dehydrogenase [Saprospiraceae bacterium]